MSVQLRSFIVLSATLASALVLRGGKAAAADDGAGGGGAVDVSNGAVSHSLAPVNGSPWHLFGGIGAGFGLVSGAGYSSSPGGPEFQVNGAVSYENDRWVIDAGAGWVYTAISGTNTLEQPVSVKTRAGFAELSPRYRLTDHWQLGPVVDFDFGTDTGFGPTISQSAFITPFVGLKLVYETPLYGWALRFFGQASTDVSGDRTATLGTVGVQIGLPFGGSSDADDGTVRSASNDSEMSPQMESEKVRELRIVLDPQKVFFGTASTTLKPRVRNVLGQIGAYLAEHPADWREVDINGHADRRGSFSYNLKLSRERAESVREILGETAESRRKMKARGFSYLRPLDPEQKPEAWARNRRVEIIFRDVKHPDFLRRKIKELSNASVAGVDETIRHGGQG